MMRPRGGVDVCREAAFQTGFYNSQHSFILNSYRSRVKPGLAGSETLSYSICARFYSPSELYTAARAHFQQLIALRQLAVCPIDLDSF